MKLKYILRWICAFLLCIWCIGICYFLFGDQDSFWPEASSSSNVNIYSQEAVPESKIIPDKASIDIPSYHHDEARNHHLLACHLPPLGQHASGNNLPKEHHQSVKQIPLILSLQHPQRPFHGNHWFHFGEYYLSQRRYLQQQYETHLLPHFPSSASSPAAAAPATTSAIQFNHIYIITPNHKIFQMATSFTFFLLLLTLPMSYQQLPISFVYSTDQHVLPNNHHWLQQVFSTPSEDSESFCPMYKIHVQKEGFHYLPDSKRIEVPQTSAVSNSHIEGYYIGSIGSIPISSSQWFHNQGEVMSFRDHLQSLCSMSKDVEDASLQSSSTTASRSADTPAGIAGSASTRKPRIVIYQRNEQRKLINVIETLLQSNKSHFEIIRNRWDIEVIIHDEHRDPCTLCRSLNDADVLITSHGFQLTGLFCLQPQSLLLEIFPYKYFKPSYFHLARSFGIDHRWFQSSTPTSRLLSGSLLGMEKEGVISLESCMKDQVCRSYARSLDIIVSEKDMNGIANVILSYEPRVMSTL